MRTALIDGDELAYKISSKYQKTFWGVYKDDKLLCHQPAKELAIESIGNQEDLELKPFIEVYDATGFEQRIKDFIDTIMFNTGSNSFRICLSGDKNFRYAMATLAPYKGNRENKDKPGYYIQFRDYLLDFYKAEIVEHLEADDLLVYLNSNIKNGVICSTDKDLRTVPSLNYNISTGLLQQIDRATSLYNFYIQLLIGDSTDNIPSPYLLGEVTAKKILSEVIGKEDEAVYYQIILEPYLSFLTKKDKEDNYKTKWYKEQPIEDILYEIGNLLYMRRTLDQNERWVIPNII